jgi:two-component system sensor histidine kinase YesM
MEFCIEDDGIGINADKLEAINKNLIGGIFHSETGYGIYNVNARVQLTYGKEYGLVLESQENVKTVSRLTLPLVLDEGAKG